MSGGGEQHSVFAKSDGSVWAAGYNLDGQLGNNSTVNSSIPVRTVGPGGTGFFSGAISADAGMRFSMALKSDGTVWGWGDGSYGQLGIGSLVNSLTPVQAIGVAGVESIAAGAFGVMALQNGGSVLQWGEGNSTTARAVSGLPPISAIADGDGHSIALDMSGHVWAWGGNNHGQLGNGTTTNSSTPVEVVGSSGAGFLGGIVSISAARGGFHSIALDSAGTVWAWGANTYGQLGNGATADSSIPVQVSGLSGISAVVAGGQHSMALSSGGGVWAWGLNYSGQVGIGTYNDIRPTPQRVQDPSGTTYLSGITEIAAGGWHSLALDAAGNVWAWGSNDNGQLALATPTAWTFKPLATSVSNVAQPGPGCPSASVPGAPGQVTATPSNGSAQVTWQPPAAAGSSPVTSYTVTASPGGATITVAVPSISATFGSLVSDCKTTYSFTVTANNAIGPSAPVVSNTILPSGIPANPPSRVVILIQGVGSSLPRTDSYDPVAGNFSYCSLRNSISATVPADLVATANYFDSTSKLIATPDPNLTDAIAATGAVILPFSYNVASFTAHPGCQRLFTVNSYDQFAPGSVPVDLAMKALNAEVQSIKCLWPSAGIVIAGHSQGGLVAEQYWQNQLPGNPANVKSVFSMDSPINGINKPTDFIVSLNLAYKGFYQEFLQAAHLSTPMLNYYFSLWNNRAANDQAILAADASGVFVPIGTDGDIVYDEPNHYAQDIYAKAWYPGIDSQLLYNPMPAAGQTGAVTGTDFQTPGHPPSPHDSMSAGDVFASHDYVLQQKDVIQKIAGAVQAASTAAAVQSRLLAQPQAGSALATAGAGVAGPLGTLSPAIAAVGNSLTITGSNFGATAGQVEFVSSTTTRLYGTIGSWSNTRVTVPVPVGATTGPVFLTAVGGATTDVGGLTVLSAVNSVASLQVTTPNSAPIDGQMIPISVKALTSRGAGIPAVYVSLSDGYGLETGQTDSTGTAPFSFPGYVGQTVIAFSGSVSTSFALTFQTPASLTMALSASSTSPTAGQTINISATVTSGSTPVANQLVKFQLNGPATATLSAPQGTTNASGVATTTVTNTGPGIVGVTGFTNYDFTSQDVSIAWSPTVATVGPVGGPSTGGTQVAITGTGFGVGATVYFGATPATGVSVGSSTSLTATSPPGHGAVDVTVSVNGAASATVAADRFTYTVPPTVTAISPQAGPTAGGTQVTITGTGYVSGATVSFGAFPAVSTVVNSATSITATSPAASSGTVDVVVSIPFGGPSDTSSADQFSYVRLPSVTAVSPNGGPTGGGTTVTIAGSNFVAGSLVSVGGQRALSIQVNSSSSITATTPVASSAAVVDVVVTTAGGTSAISSADQFAFGPPTVTGVSPSAGPLAGGTQVVISGTNFVAGATVNFGAQPAANVTVNSSTSITATSPAGVAGAAHVMVATQGGTSTLSSADTFTYQ